MSKTILAHVEGWTPVIDHLVKEFGITTALVFGVVWRYCQRTNHVCYASQEVLANHVGMTRQALNKHLAVLVKAKYLEDLTPNRTNRPHTYKDTGKANLTAIISATVNQDYSTVNDVDSTVNQDYTNTLLNTESIKQPSGKKTPLESDSSHSAGTGNDDYSDIENQHSPERLAAYDRRQIRDAEVYIRENFPGQFDRKRFSAACQGNQLYRDAIGKAGGCEVITEFYQVLCETQENAINYLRQKFDLPQSGPLADYLHLEMTP